MRAVSKIFYLQLNWWILAWFIFCFHPCFHLLISPLIFLVSFSFVLYNFIRSFSRKLTFGTGWGKQISSFACSINSSSSLIFDHGSWIQKKCLALKNIILNLVIENFYKSNLDRLYFSTMTRPSSQGIWKNSASLVRTHSSSVSPVSLFIQKRCTYLTQLIPESSKRIIYPCLVSFKNKPSFSPIRIDNLILQKRFSSFERKQNISRGKKGHL